MSRPLRIEFPGAVYHATSRGNERRPVFRDEEEEVYSPREAVMAYSAREAAIAGPASPAGAEATFYYWDHLGTVRMTAGENPTAETVERHDYEPYGLEMLPATNVAGNTHQFTGHERDLDTGIDYMHARYYGGNMGRFMRPDPLDLGNQIKRSLTDPQAWNLYSYVRGNPVIAADPTGLTTYIIAYGTTDDACTQDAYKQVAEAEAAKIKASDTYSADSDQVIVQQVSQGAEVEALQSTEYKTGPVNLTVIGHATAGTSDPKTVGAIAMNVHESDKRNAEGEIEHTVKGIPLGYLRPEEFQNMQKGNAAPGLPTQLVGCNTATPGAAGQPSLAQEAANALGQPAGGYTGNILFPGLNSANPSNPAQWIIVQPSP
jgi:RHS repeat-associated protein